MYCIVTCGARDYNQLRPNPRVLDGGLKSENGIAIQVSQVKLGRRGQWRQTSRKYCNIPNAYCMS